MATNLYGDSPFSPSGSGAIMMTTPDAPINLINDLTVTTRSVIKIMWSSGYSNGGSSIIDYRVSFDQSTGIWVVLQESVSV